MTRPESRLHLISHRLCPYVQRARIVLAEKAIPCEVEFIDLARKPAWFAALSPLGKVPVLLVGGRPLFESAVITEYLDEVSPGSLHPAEPFARARNRSWIEFASSTLDVIAGFYSARDAAAFETHLGTLDRRFATLEGVLDQAPYFNGNDFALVDAAFATVFRYFDVIEAHADFGLFRDRPALSAWRRELARRDSVRRAAVSDYAERLEDFLRARGGVLSRYLAPRRTPDAAAP